MPHHGRRVAAALKLTGDLAKQARSQVAKSLYDAFVGTDMRAMLEINPLADQAGQAAGARRQGRLRFNALFRHPDLMELRDETEEDPKEVEASKYDLAYIKLDGNIGCMVNGAGLAMATMDIIKLNGDVPGQLPRCRRRRQQGKGDGGVQDHPQADPAVKGILVNIFGGIMKCDIIAEGIVAAAKEVNLSVPLVVRLEGTNVQQGKDILAAPACRSFRPTTWATRRRRSSHEVKSLIRLPAAPG
jgi:succinyl-CoA synthetase beta subunit